MGFDKKYGSVGPFRIIVVVIAQGVVPPKTRCRAKVHIACATFKNGLDTLDVAFASLL